MEHVNKELERVKCHARGAEARYRSGRMAEATQKGPGTVQYIHTYRWQYRWYAQHSADVERRDVSGRREAQFIGAT
jgi:hypothetical protein